MTAQTTTGGGAVTAAALRDRIRAHYIRPVKVRRGGHLDDQDLLPGAVVLTEVPGPSGRRIDALAIGLTRARAGLDGFEIKVSRSDWLHELDQLHKADAWFGHTHRWWVLAPSTAIVRAEELPANWGLMIPDPRSARRLKVVVKATTRTPVLDWPVLWEIVKKLDRGRANEISQAVDTVREHMRVEAREQAKRATEAMFAPNSEEAQIGRVLTEITGLDPFTLRFTLEQTSPWMREALPAVVAAARASAPGGRRDHRWVVDQAKYMAGEHQATAAALLRAATALERPGEDAR